MQRLFQKGGNVMKTKKFLCIVMTIILVSLCTISALAQEHICIVSYPVNENGETYGTAIQAELIGYEPELILAVGKDNITGYIRTSDLDDGIKTPQEATNVNRTTKNNKYIPLYAVDGTTILGDFSVSTDSQETNPQKSVVEWTWCKQSTIEMGDYYTAYARAAISDCTNGVKGRTRLSTDILVDAGWLGVQVRIYRATDNALVDSSTYEYNNITDSFIEKENYHATFKFDVAYYSKGSVKVWNPDTSSYKTYSTNKSPNVNPSFINP